MRKTTEYDPTKATWTTLAGLAAMLSVGKDTANRIGTEAGAKIKVGRRVLFNVERVNKYLENLLND